MYIDGPWGGGQHKKTLKTINVPIPAGPSGNNGTLLITDSIAVFKGTGHENVAMELARALSSGQAQYELDSSWGCLLYTSPSPRDLSTSRMPSSA